MINSLYIHIPFCLSICPYCDFIKIIKNQKIEDAYMSSLFFDIDNLIKRGFHFKTIYLGGGTPSALSLKNLESLLIKLNPLLDLDEYEFTIEANPESLDETKLKLFKKYRINRISIGIESFDEKILNLIERNYGIDIDKLISLVKKYFSNINIDLIYGFKEEDQKILKEDLNRFIKLDVPHISIYNLTVNPMSFFYNRSYKPQSDDQSREDYDIILKTLRENGYRRYEVSNFCKGEMMSKHNLTYWNNAEYIGIGVGASGYYNNIRYKMSSSLSSYIKGLRKMEEEKIDLHTLKEYFFLTNLRKDDGFNLDDYAKIFNEDFYLTYKDIIDELTEEKLVELSQNRFYCTDEGLIILDKILLKLF